MVVILKIISSFWLSLLLFTGPSYNIFKAFICVHREKAKGFIFKCFYFDKVKSEKYYKVSLPVTLHIYRTKMDFLENRKMYSSEALTFPCENYRIHVFYCLKINWIEGNILISWSCLIHIQYKAQFGKNVWEKASLLQLSAFGFII